MSLHDLLPALRPVVDEFERRGVEYYIGGSVASSYYGEPRSTLDIDLGADLRESQVAELVAVWNHDFYVSEPAMRDAIQRGRCFNLIHLSSTYKVDVFVRGSDPFSASVFSRRRPHPITIGDESITVWFASPEDVILQKLSWYRKGGETSERQWRDIALVWKYQQETANADYIAAWAARLNVLDLWERIRGDAAAPSQPLS
jgi:hypothetical protein